MILQKCLQFLENENITMQWKGLRIWQINKHWWTVGILYFGKGRSTPCLVTNQKLNAQEWEWENQTGLNMSKQAKLLKEQPSVLPPRTTQLTTYLASHICNRILFKSHLLPPVSRPGSSLYSAEGFLLSPPQTSFTLPSFLSKFPQWPNSSIFLSVNTPHLFQNDLTETQKWSDPCYLLKYFNGYLPSKWSHTF